MTSYMEAKMVKAVVIDSDAIYALYNRNDPLHARATLALHKLTVQGFKVVYPSSVLFEAVSLFQRVLSTPIASSKLAEMIDRDQVSIEIIDQELLRESVQLFNPSGSKKNTLVDCSVVAVARRMKAKGVFSYDNFYAKHGLKSAEDVVTR